VTNIGLSLTKDLEPPLSKELTNQYVFYIRAFEVLISQNKNYVKQRLYKRDENPLHLAAKKGSVKVSIFQKRFVETPSLT
jgi:hypothetical protein